MIVVGSKVFRYPLVGCGGRGTTAAWIKLDMRLRLRYDELSQENYDRQKKLGLQVKLVKPDDS